MRNFIKIPIALVHSKQVEMGISEPDEERAARAYFDPEDICCIRMAHDDALDRDSIGQLNFEASVFSLKNGETFLVYMHMDELIELLKNHITCP